MQKPANTDIYEFGEFRLDAGNRLLWRGEQPVKLSLKEFEVLFFLADNAGRVIAKTELHEAVWKDTFIEEGTLTQNISRLRKKLEAASDAAEELIETVPKRGYRFLPAVKRRRIIAPAASLSAEEIAASAAIQQIVFSSGNSPRSNTQENPPVETPVFPAASEKEQTGSRKSKWKWLALAGTALLCIAAILFWKSIMKPPAPVKSLVAANVIPFSGATGVENTPAFSPDGKQIVYSWNGDEESRQKDIYVRLISGGDPVRLTENDLNEQYPVFSPDGSKVAFVRNFGTYGEVILIPALGGTEQRVCRLFSGNYSISFAPDGKSIAVIDTEDSTDKKQYAVYLVDLDTGSRRRLTNPGEFLGETTPRFSPDGKTIAFVRVFDEQRQDLFTVPVSQPQLALTNEPRQITSDRKVIHSLAWSHDGASLFFISFRGSNRAGMWRISPEGGGQEPESVLTGSRDITNLAISPDGKTIAFVENETHNLDIWQAGSGEEKAQKFLASTFNEYYPVITADDSHVIFTSNRSGKNELWAADLAGKNLRQLTKTEVAVGRSAVSPDGKRAVFEASLNFTVGLFITDFESGTTRELIASDGSANAFAAWSADGRWIYFTSNRTGSDQIWRVAADETSDGGSSKPSQVTTQGGYRAYPAPDGTLFVNRTRDTADLWQIRNLSGGNPIESRVTESKIISEADRWTAARAGIYFFFKDSGDTYDVKFYDFASRQITSTQAKIRFPDQIYNAFAITSDGKKLLYATDTATASHIVFAELEQ